MTLERRPSGISRSSIPEDIQMAFLRMAETDYNASQKRVIGEDLLVVYRDRTRVTRVYHVWHPSRPLEDQQFPSYAFITMIDKGNKKDDFRISIYAENNMVEISKDGPFVRTYFATNNRELAVIYDNSQFKAGKSRSQIDPFAELTAPPTHLGIPIRNVHDYTINFHSADFVDDITVSEKIDLVELQSTIAPILQNPFWAPARADDGWKMFDYRKFVGLKWDQTPPPTSYTELIV